MTGTAEAPTQADHDTGLDVHLDVQGWPSTVRRSGSGRTVVFLHGAFFPSRWLPFHDALAARFDLVAPVTPGYLEGGPPAWMLGWDDLVLHQRALLDQLDIERFDLVGYDIGGWMAANFAAFHPERVRSLTVIAPMGLRVPDAPPMEWMAADPQRVVDALFNGDPGDHADLFPPPSDIEGFVNAYGENGVTARLIWEKRYDTRLDRRLSNISVPARVITPADDRIIPAVHAQRWADTLRDATLTTLDGVGHALLVQDPAGVADVVADFIESVPASPTSPSAQTGAAS
jgi:pimeloyl-ACP methyl ester carboxylesterase